MKIISNNKKARHDYFLEDRYEAGIELVGTEIKSIRTHGASLRDSYVKIEGGEAYVVNMHIAPYDQGNIFNHDPRRDRRLLLHKKEIRKLERALTEQGLTIVPTMLYFNAKSPKVKLEIAVARGKKLYDKRQSIKERDIKRDMDKAMKKAC